MHNLKEKKEAEEPLTAVNSWMKFARMQQQEHKMFCKRFHKEDDWPTSKIKKLAEKNKMRFTDLLVSVAVQKIRIKINKVYSFQEKMNVFQPVNH